MTCEQRLASTITSLLPCNTPHLVTFSIPDASSSHSMHGPASSELGRRHAGIVIASGTANSFLGILKYISGFTLSAGTATARKICEHELSCWCDTGPCPSVICFYCVYILGGTLTGVAAPIYVSFIACLYAIVRRCGSSPSSFCPWLRGILPFRWRHVLSRISWWLACPLISLSKGT
ncbi:hypothetical protein BDU57DRAFT_175396 [Ampelomyces quisqualis]|uniref:Uncharacterized protein n=1 Tax=Ampelomyces quisqualis TaxID=50730 RepID=A0A6A5QSA8_AMPQU|nr:hypothetical protein BDU57DRAFT_175396 [Ampelomyces quisqualis]